MRKGCDANRCGLQRQTYHHHRAGFLADRTGDTTSPGYEAIARLLTGIVVGLLFGLVMSVVSNLFVIAVKAVSGLREGYVADLLVIGDSGPRWRRLSAL